MASSDEFQTWAAQAICGLNMTFNYNLGGQYMRLHIGPPGVNGANQAPGVAPSAALTWATVSPTGGGTVKITSNPVTFSLPASAATYTDYGIYNGAGQFLYGKPLSSTINVPSGQVATITVTAEMTYELI